MTYFLPPSLIYITDWFSTFLHIAGLKHKIPDNVDSFSMWKTISKNKKSPQHEIILNLDQDDKRGLWSAAIIKKKYKLIWGSVVYLGLSERCK